VLDDVAGVTDDARDEDLAVRQLRAAPDLPLVLVLRVRRPREYASAVTLSIRSTTCFRGRSCVCGPCQLPQQMWYRMRSSGRPLSAWFIASTRISANRR
jgi:hypothetical protein